MRFFIGAAVFLQMCVAEAGTAKVVASTKADFILSGTQVFEEGELMLRSGNAGQHTSAAFPTAQVLTPDTTLESVSFSYRYVAGYGPAGSGIGANFTVSIAGTPVYLSPHLKDYSYDENHTNYSAPLVVDAHGLNITVPTAKSTRIEIDFQNNDRNLQLLLPLQITLTCSSDSPSTECTAPYSPPAPPPICTPGPIECKEPICDLFHQLDACLPRGFYRIPGLVATTNGTLLAFIMGRMHRTDGTPNIVYLRRSHDDGATWEAAIPVLNDPTNRTMYGGAPVVDPATGMVHFIHNQARGGCSGCPLWITSSSDNGATWSTAARINITGAEKMTWGGALASGVTLTRGPHEGRMLVALRNDCCGHIKTSNVAYSDDHGTTWTGGDEMELLPTYGGGWTESQVAELINGSVLMTSRNFYGKSSGQGPRLFARSDDGGATWAANWSAGDDITDPYCEGSILSNPSKDDTIYFGNPSSHGRGNYSIHASHDGGRSWPDSYVVYPGGAAYSDLAFTRNGSIAVLFEKDNYNTLSFALVPAPLPAPTRPAMPTHWV